MKIAVSPETTSFHKNEVDHDIWGSTLGIVGMGGIGYKVAERAKGFKMKILYHNRSRRFVFAYFAHSSLHILFGIIKLLGGFLG